MSLLTHLPDPPLSEFVECLWLYEARSTATRRERLIPDGSMELVIDLREEPFQISEGQGHDKLVSFREGVLIGVHSEPFVLLTGESTSVIGAHFKPGGAFPFLKVPAGEIHGAVLSFDAIWGRSARELRQRLLETPSPEARFRRLEEYLLDQQPFCWNPVVAFALREIGERTSTIAEVSERSGLSQRQFIRIFRDHVGLGPKLHSRLQRFQDVLRHIGREAEIDWAGLALDYGYYDQAHFIRDFRAFSGFSPGAYLARRGDRSHHFPLEST